MKENKEDDFFEEPAAPDPADRQADRPADFKRTVRIAALVLGGLFLAVAAFLGGWYGRYLSLDAEVRTYLWAKSVVDKNYYRPVEDGELYTDLFGTLALDPYTKLYTAEEYEKYMAQGAGENKGVGISFYKDSSEEVHPRFFSVVENSPAARAGLRKGMRLLGFGIDENSLAEGNYDAFAEFLSEQTGKIVLRCGYEEDGSDAKNYTLEKESYQASFLYYRDSDGAFRFNGEGKKPKLTETDEKLEGLDDKTAYIRLDEFSGNNTPDEFVQLLGKMKERGRRDLILDLRTNGGGYLSILGELASHLLRSAEKSRPVVTVTRSRSGQVTNSLCPRNDFSDYFSEDSSLYLLADEFTASASECLIGALVDYGTLPFSHIFLRENEKGEAKTFGKGIMQSHFENANGAAMKLTTATVYWPLSGKSIHGVGVTEADGAVGIPAPLFGGRDVMLEEVLSRVCP